MDFNTIRIILIVVLVLYFIVLVTLRTKESLRWVLLGEEFGDKGKQLTRDHDRLEQAGLHVRMERGVKTSFLFRRFSKDLDDRVALYVLKEELPEAEAILGQRS
ncbi:hypothetical protein [Bacillales bacterium]|uniref:hypothetical protein n=1 Tax=Exiguobacterium sp. S22-S28 TaxID=3342768 RepID=UPI0011CA99F0